MFSLTLECESQDRFPVPTEVLFHMWEQMGIDHLEHQIVTISVTYRDSRCKAFNPMAWPT